MAALVWLLLALPGAKGPEQVMLANQVKVHRPVQAADRRAFAALPQRLVIIDSPPQDPAELVQEFAQAASAAPAPLPSQKPLYLLAPGPTLDGPDKVLVRNAILHGQQVDVEILYTAVRLQDVPLRRNVPWRPVVELPLKLPPGRFQIRVTWRAVAGLPDGQPLPTPPTSNMLQCEVRPGD